MSMQDFAGKVAVITGGANGLGLAMARRFGAAGMKIVIGDIETGALADAEASLAADGIEVIGRRTDVALSGDLEALADAAYERFGAVHVLANNAGVGGSPGAMWELSEADWQWVIDVDLWSVIHGIRAFVPRMIDGGEEGHVINTASVAGLISGAVGGPYTVAKFGVVALSEQLYFELGRAEHPIGVSVLCPGFVNTRIYDSGRNRQESYGQPTVDQTPERAELREALEAMRETMIQPDTIGDRVFDAVAANQLYIVEPGTDVVSDAIQSRLDHVSARSNPGLDFGII
jgi:NAD(P)-dependent dehydrogenase (short-subunit alcohol dehydrogenase family)